MRNGKFKNVRPEHIAFCEYIRSERSFHLYAAHKWRAAKLEQQIVNDTLFLDRSDFFSGFALAD